MNRSIATAEPRLSPAVAAAPGGGGGVQAGSAARSERSDWFAPPHQNEPPRSELSVNGVWRVVHTGMCYFRFILLKKGAHEMVERKLFLVAATFKIFFFVCLFLPSTSR